MCGANIRFYIYLFIGLLSASVAGVLHGGEPGQWYLISETELQSIERYRNSREAERQAWLLQVNALKADSENLNALLAQAREANRNLTSSFNRYEAGQLILISSKNGEIAGLEQALSEQTLQTEKHKGDSRLRLVIVIALAGAWIGFIMFKICRFFRLI
jgi:hypothetical protein